MSKYRAKVYVTFDDGDLSDAAEAAGLNRSDRPQAYDWLFGILQNQFADFEVEEIREYTRS